MLRDYQQKTIDHLYDWFCKNETGNPCVVLPTGAGKSHVIAVLCKDSLQQWPTTRILVLTHVKELIEQNAEKMRQHWPNAPMGIYSASIGKKQLGEPITFAGIQSIVNKSDLIGYVDIVIIDECHLVNNNDEGSYRILINALSKTNPSLRIVGFTATPYRLGHGLIIEKPGIFDDIIEPISIEELIYNNYLAPLKSKHTNLNLDVSGVHKRGGEFIESELHRAVDKADTNEAIVDEVIARAAGRQAWLFFCSGVKHAHHIKDILIDRGIVSECVTGDMTKKEREKILNDFKSGKVQAVTNANVLTTGFDYPNIDLIAMLRPTMSPGLYVQMAGRGMRPKTHTDHCLVLDFAGVVSMHGPITAVQPPKKHKKGDAGEAPVKVCPECNELVHPRAKECPSCEYKFPLGAKAEEVKLYNDDIMGIEGTDLYVRSWVWREHTSRSSGKNMLCVSYYGDLSDLPVIEYFPITHEGFAGQKAIFNVKKIAREAGIANDIFDTNDIAIIANNLNNGTPPSLIEYRKDGKFYKVIKRIWNESARTETKIRA